MSKIEKVINIDKVIRKTEIFNYFFHYKLPLTKTKKCDNSDLQPTLEYSDKEKTLNKKIGQCF